MDAEKAVRLAEAAYQSQDVDRVMDLFDPKIIMYWNGQKVAEGSDGVRKWHEKSFLNAKEFKIHKTLRAATGESIALEWTNSWLDKNGVRHEGYGGEFWTMRNGRVLEWHAYYSVYSHESTAEKEDQEHGGGFIFGRTNPAKN